MLVDAFDFDLPAGSIALHPARPRDSARLLVVEPDGGRPAEARLTDQTVLDLPEWLTAGDVLVVNDTRVIPARLTGTRTRGATSARIEATLHKREGADTWRAFVRPAKKLTPGEHVRFSSVLSADTTLVAEVAEKGGDGEVLLRFALAGAELDAAVGLVGAMPLPPYIAGRRPADAADAADYQTMFASDPGAVAAPTAGLHFTPALVRALEARGITLHRITLHVGAGTFLPVKVAETGQHSMHAEWGEIDAATAQALDTARKAGGRLVAVGSTSLRILETAAAPDGTLRAFSGDTAIFITPGYRFRAVDALLTNFHLPRSTLFMLVAAFAGLETMHAAYRHAIASGYRFYSYGDASLLFRATPAEQGDA